MDLQTLLITMDFSRTRLLATISAIEKSGQDTSKVLAWRPGPGRAHIAWQLLHCAATHHRNLYVAFLGGAAKDEALVAGYAGGSTPSEENIPSLERIKQTLESSYAEYKAYIAGLSQSDLLNRKIGPPDRQRLLGDALVLYIWHEAHHQGQIHLTWNMYKAAHGVA
jgi:hypothetical protein